MLTFTVDKHVYYTLFPPAYNYVFCRTQFKFIAQEFDEETLDLICMFKGLITKRQYDTVQMLISLDKKDEAEKYLKRYIMKDIMSKSEPL